MNPEQQKKPAETYEDAALDAVFTQLLLEEAEELMAKEPTEEEALLLAQLEERLPQQLERLDRDIRCKELKHRAWVQTRAFLRTAAAILAIVFLGLGTAIAANEPFRLRLINFLTNATTEYITMGFVRNPTAPEIPDGWLASHYPAYLPEGYEFAGMSSNKNMSCVMYERDGDTIIFHSYTSSNVSQINARYAVTQSLRLHGQEATLVTIDNQNTIVWSEDDVYFSVTASSPGIAIDVADSIAPIP